MSDDESSAASSSSSDVGEQVRISFLLSSEIQDKSLQVPSEPIAVPADIRQKGLSAVLNHLLDRQEDDLQFDFLIKNKLLRTGVEAEARQYGISLEEAIPITYFPVLPAPQLEGEAEPVPDWISQMQACRNQLFTGTYDGSIYMYRTKGTSIQMMQTNKAAHSAPIKCMAVAESSSKEGAWIASGSLDQQLLIHSADETGMKLDSKCEHHSSTVTSVAWNETQQLISGDWDGTLCLWSMESPKTTSKKQKSEKKTSATVHSLDPKAFFSAHSSQISGLSFASDQVVSASWDHSIKVWDLESQNCLLTLNGSRVVACLDRSSHSTGVVATGHPDCTVRLWDVRTDSSTGAVSDTTFRPSHKAWVTAVRWSLVNPYKLASTSHDGTIKIWDIRSSLPLHTVRAFEKDEKGLCLSYGADEILYAGGTDCIVKQYAQATKQ